MSLESTPKYKKKLEAIRQRPQVSESDKIVKREAAKEFRMEVMLDNARLMQELTAQLEGNPWATALDLEASIKKSAEYSAHPEVAEAFIRDLQDARKRVKEVLEKNKEDGAHGIYRQIALFGFDAKSLDQSQNTSFGEMSLDINYPFAVVLYIEDEKDFDRVDERKNVGGFYRNSMQFNTANDQTVIFPLIVTRGRKPEKETSFHTRVKIIEEHEKGHAEHQSLMNALKVRGRKTVWLDFNDINHKQVAELSFLGQKEGVEKQWNYVMGYVLERARDEMLADFKATGRLLFQLSNLRIREGIYDYFKGFGIHPGSRMYEGLWAEYDGYLNLAYDAVKDLLALYKRLGLNQRIDLMRWVLAQIPLKDWSKQIEKSAFQEEMKALEDIIEKAEVPQPVKGVLKLYGKFLIDIQSNQSHSFMPQIRSFYDQYNQLVQR